ncbi:MAG: site-specific DNA-methyltransferase [Patescibacteria group bacterium]
MLEVNRIHTGDCLELMREIPDGSIDTVITDPPYGMGKDFSGNGSDGELLAMSILNSVMPGIARVLKPTGMAVIFMSTRLIDRLIEYGKGADLKFERMMWLYKPNDCTFPWRGWLLTSEAIAVLSHGKLPKWGGDTYSHDCYQFNHAGGELPEGYHHPSVKPRLVIQDIILKTTLTGDLILDPFLGSGTTAVAALRTGRRFIGIEISPEYCKIAQKRVDAELAQGKLDFDAPAPRAFNRKDDGFFDV